LESLLFAAQKPLSASDLRSILAAAELGAEPSVRAFKQAPVEQIEALLGQLAQDYEQAGRSYRLVCVAGAWQFVSQPEYAPWLKALAGERARPARLSLPALETLSIIAYRQPITRAEMEQIRGVSVDGVMQTLLERGLVEQVGRAEVVGRPATYGTTKLFLEYFGLRSLADLPAADELRRVPVERPPGLLTLQPGLATAVPEQLGLEEAGSGSPPAPAPAEPAGEAGADTGTSCPHPDLTAEPDKPGGAGLSADTPDTTTPPRQATEPPSTT
jgi:segregation and condensation protein B